jgi:hypothetical protein
MSQYADTVAQAKSAAQDVKQPVEQSPAYERKQR